MLYLLNAYWIPLLLAALLGVIVGWMSCNNQTIAHNARPSWFSGWVPWGIAAAALAALAAVQMLLPGKQGLLLDTALMLFGAYMLGCCIGCILRPKPAAHLATAGALSANKSGTAKSGSTGKVTAAAAVGTAATAASLAAAKSASGSTTAKSSATPSTSSAASKTTGSSTGSGAVTTGATKATAPVAEPAKTSTVANLASTGAPKTEISGTAGTTTSSNAGANGSKVATALGTAAAGVVATAATVAATATTTATAAGSAAADSNLKVFTGAPKFGTRPALYNAPRGGKGDELSLIWGVAEKLEHKMNAAGIWHFDQIANWTPDHVEWFEHEFEGFKGRLDRDKWIEQCKKLAAGWRPDGHVGQRPKG
jgi:predicted flap endonuclease-1-like 5' DNA nuclease